MSENCPQSAPKYESGEYMNSHIGHMSSNLPHDLFKKIGTCFPCFQIAKSISTLWNVNVFKRKLLYGLHIFFKYPGTVFDDHLEVKTMAVVTYCHVLLQRKFRVVTLSC